ncbi:hypothetical protein [Macrococcoides caseolyticum]|uniref:hypothetical protein n=1 Tax=Macrococcoides caseolyticum TaxID=69966 RepID=UPI0012FED98B|nr:hypothetical protein [Macrococcus caseolyticus]
MHKEIRFTKQELLDILAGKIIEARDVDGVLHRFMLAEEIKNTKKTKYVAGLAQDIRYF